MDKDSLRKQLRATRRETVNALPESMRALVFHRPPAPILNMVADNAIVGLYRANPFEAPTASYAKFFHEHGHTIALPRFASPEASMEFAEFTDPYDEDDLEVGPFGILQPVEQARTLTPNVIFTPLVGFTEAGMRLGQGGGHYDRWLAANPDAIAIGLAWDSQKVDLLPLEPHDRPLRAVTTPTRFYGPFA